MDRGQRTGVTEDLSLPALDFIEGVGLRMAELASPIAGLLDCLAIKFIEGCPIVKSTSKTALKEASHISFI